MGICTGLIYFAGERLRAQKKTLRLVKRKKKRTTKNTGSQYEQN